MSNATDLVQIRLLPQGAFQGARLDQCDGRRDGHVLTLLFAEPWARGLVPVEIQRESEVLLGTVETVAEPGRVVVVVEHRIALPAEPSKGSIFP